ncbi:MAG TPA: BBE domain-containing protein [Actinomycetes bacterium]|nr:BBE domain-containing protein [Actinomycetes bacterium]
MRAVQLRCWAGRWPACPPRPPPSRTATGGSWPTSPRSTSDPSTSPCARPGSPTSPRPCARGVSPAHTSASSTTRAGASPRSLPGSTWARLAAIKRRYDPANLLRLNQNIPPAIEDTQGP